MSSRRLALQRRAKQRRVALLAAAQANEQAVAEEREGRRDEWRVALSIHDDTDDKDDDDKEGDDEDDSEAVFNAAFFPSLQEGDVVALIVDAAHANGGNSGDADDETPRDSAELLLKVTRLQTGVSGTWQLSLCANLAELFELRPRQSITVRRLSASQLDAATADHVELVFEGQYISHGDMFLFRQWLAQETLVVHLAKPVKARGMRARVCDLVRSRQSLKCGVIGPNTKFVFRSSSARVFVMLHVTGEMWHFDEEGDLLQEKAIDVFLRSLHRKWTATGARHLVSVVLFSRTYLRHKRPVSEDGVDDVSESDDPTETTDGAINDSAISDHSDRNTCLRRLVERKLLPPPLDTAQCDCFGRVYVDWYVVCFDSVPSDELPWRVLAAQLRGQLARFPRMAKWNRCWRVTLKNNETVEIVGEAAKASDGNILEAVNLCCNMLQHHFLDRELQTTGQAVFVVTAGTGVFLVPPALGKVTKQRVIDIGIGVDVISVAAPPLHVTPLLVFHDAGGRRRCARSPFGLERRSAMQRMVTPRYFLPVYFFDRHSLSVADRRAHSSDAHVEVDEEETTALDARAKSILWSRFAVQRQQERNARARSRRKRAIPLARVTDDTTLPRGREVRLAKRAWSRRPWWLDATRNVPVNVPHLPPAETPKIVSADRSFVSVATPISATKWSSKVHQLRQKRQHEQVHRSHSPKSAPLSFERASTLRIPSFQLDSTHQPLQTIHEEQLPRTAVVNARVNVSRGSSKNKFARRLPNTLAAETHVVEKVGPKLVSPLLPAFEPKLRRRKSRVVGPRSPEFKASTLHHLVNMREEVEDDGDVLRFSQRFKTNPFRSRTSMPSLLLSSTARWSHMFRVFGGLVDDAQHVNWKSLVVPAALPLATDFRPSEGEMSQYRQYAYSVEAPLQRTSDTTYDSEQGAELLFRELIVQRLSQDYQTIVSKDGAGACRKVLREIGAGQLRSGVVSVELALSKRVLQKMTLDVDTGAITVKRFEAYPQAMAETSAEQEEEHIDYAFNLWSPLRKSFLPGSAVFRNYQRMYRWNDVDNYVASGGRAQIPRGAKAKRIRFALLPSCARSESHSLEHRCEQAQNFARFLSDVCDAEFRQIGVAIVGEKEAASAGARVASECRHTPSRGGDDEGQGFGARGVAFLSRRRPLQVYDTRPQWMVLKYDAHFDACCCYQFEIQWLVASGVSVANFLAYVRRRAKFLKLHLVQIPTDASDELSDPFRATIRVPLCAGARDRLEHSLRTQLHFLYDCHVCGLEHMTACGPRPTQYIHETGCAMVRLSEEALVWVANSLPTRSWRTRLQTQAAVFERLRQLIDALAADRD